MDGLVIPLTFLARLGMRKQGIEVESCCRVLPCANRNWPNVCKLK